MLLEYDSWIDSSRSVGKVNSNFCPLGKPCGSAVVVVFELVVL